MENNEEQELNSPFEFLLLYVSEERAKLLTDAYNTLLDLGYDTLTDEVLRILRESENMPTEYTVGAFNQLVSYVQADALRKHGITMRVDAGIGLVDSLLRAILLLADYEDVDQLLSSFQLAIMTDPIDVFTDLLEEVLGDDEADEIALHITNISSAFLPAMKQYLMGILAEREDNDLHATMAIDDVTLFKLRRIGEVAEESMDIQMPTLLSGIMPPKLSFRYYIGELAYRHRNATDMRVIAIDMLMAAAISEECPEDPLPLLGEYTADFTMDTNKQADIISRARAIIGDLAIEPK